MRGAVLGLVAACTGGSHVAPDAPPPVPFTYELGVYSSQEPARTDPPTVYIDGAPTTTISMMYASAADADGTMHLVELRYADEVIASWPVTVSGTPICGGAGPLVKRSEAVEKYDTGDLRQGGFSEQTNLLCVGDPSLVPNCQCSSSQRCGLRVVRDAPVFTHLRCTAIGPKQVGEACSLTPDPDGAYDDCGSDLICYQGTCHALCNSMACTTGCMRPDGYPYEATLCI